MERVDISEAFRLMNAGNTVEYADGTTERNFPWLKIWKVLTPASRVSADYEFRVRNTFIVDRKDYDWFAKQMREKLIAELGIPESVYSECFIENTTERGYSIKYRITNDWIMAIGYSECTREDQFGDCRKQRNITKPTDGSHFEDYRYYSEIYGHAGFDYIASDYIPARYIIYSLSMPGTTMETPFDMDSFPWNVQLSIRDDHPTDGDVDGFVHDICMLLRPLVQHFTFAMRHSMEYFSLVNAAYENAYIELPAEVFNGGIYDGPEHPYELVWEEAKAQLWDKNVKPAYLPAGAEYETYLRYRFDRSKLVEAEAHIFPASELPPIYVKFSTEENDGFKTKKVTRTEPLRSYRSVFLDNPEMDTFTMEYFNRLYLESKFMLPTL